MEISQIIFFIASLLTLSALFSRDMLILQALFLTANLLFLGSSIFFHIPVMIAMNICYVSVNCYQIIRLCRERLDAVIPPDLRPVYHAIFPMMRPYEFIGFVRLGTQEQLAKDQYFCRDGDTQNILALVIKGKVAVEKMSSVLSALSGYFFLGEMRYLTQKPMSADIRILESLTYLKWNYETLDKLKEKKPDIYTKLCESLGKDLIVKIQAQNNLFGSMACTT